MEGRRIFAAHVLLEWPRGYGSDGAGGFAGASRDQIRKHILTVTVALILAASGPSLAGEERRRSLVAALEWVNAAFVGDANDVRHGLGSIRWRHMCVRS